jgi:hypothetical protein
MKIFTPRVGFREVAVQAQFGDSKGSRNKWRTKGVQSLSGLWFEGVFALPRGP